MTCRPARLAGAASAAPTSKKTRCESADRSSKHLPGPARGSRGDNRSPTTQPRVQNTASEHAIKGAGRFDIRALRRACRLSGHGGRTRPATHGPGPPDDASHGAARAFNRIAWAYPACAAMTQCGSGLRQAGVATARPQGESEKTVHPRCGAEPGPRIRIQKLEKKWRDRRRGWSAGAPKRAHFDGPLELSN